MADTACILLSSSSIRTLYCCLCFFSPLRKTFNLSKLDASSISISRSSRISFSIESFTRCRTPNVLDVRNSWTVNFRVSKTNSLVLLPFSKPKLVLIWPISFGVSLSALSQSFIQSIHFSKTRATPNASKTVKRYVDISNDCVSRTKSISILSSSPYVIASEMPVSNSASVKLSFKNF